MRRVLAAIWIATVFCALQQPGAASRFDPVTDAQLLALHASCQGSGATGYTLQVTGTGTFGCAASSPGSGALRYDTPQGLTAAQQAQGRANVGIPSNASIRVLLNTLTANNSATLTDTSISTSYTEYEYQFENVVCATNNDFFQANVQQAGAITTTGYNSQLAYLANTASSVNSVTPTAYIQLSVGIASSGYAGFSGKMLLSNPANTGRNNVSIPQGFSFSSSFLYSSSGGSVTPSGAITGMRFQCNASNMTSGTIKVYGYN